MPLAVDTADELLITDGLRTRLRRLPRLLLPTLVSESENTTLLGVRTELLSSVEGTMGTGDNAGNEGGGAEVITLSVSGIVDMRSKDDHEPLGRRKDVSKEVSGSCSNAALVALGEGASRLDSYETLVSVAQRRGLRGIGNEPGELLGGRVVTGREGVKLDSEETVERLIVEIAVVGSWSDSAELKLGLGLKLKLLLVLVLVGMGIGIGIGLGLGLGLRLRVVLALRLGLRLALALRLRLGLALALWRLLVALKVGKSDGPLGGNDSKLELPSDQ